MSGKTNQFMVFLLQPKSTEIVMDGKEIAQCQWMNIDDYIEKQSKRMPKGSIYHEMSMVGLAAYEGAVQGFDARRMTLGEICSRCTQRSAFASILC